MLGGYFIFAAPCICRILLISALLLSTHSAVEMLHDSALYKFMIDIDITINDVFSSPTRKLFFCLNPAVSNQNNRVWTGGKKADISM